MDWLKTILEKAEIKDGVLDIDKLMSTINVEAPKNVMPKAEYNNINEQLKTANNTIEQLKKDNKDNTELQNKIKEHETTISDMEKNHKTEIEIMKKENAVKDVLRNVKYQDLLLGKFNMDNIKINEDGSFSGIDEQMKTVREQYKDLFEAEKDNNGKGVKVHTPSGNEDKPNNVSAGSNFAKEMNASEKPQEESKFFN